MKYLVSKFFSLTLYISLLGVRLAFGGEGWGDKLLYQSPDVDLTGKISHTFKPDYEFIQGQISQYKMESLNLSQNSIERENFENLAKVISSHSTLKKLTITKSLDSMQAMILLEQLKDSGLTELDLSSNQINGWGLANIEAFLKSSKALKTLDLSSNPIKGEIAPQIQNGLAKNTSLQSLKLKNIQLDGIGLSKIVEGLCMNTSLTDLDLSQNLLGDAGAVSIKLLLSESTGIKRINVSRCGFSRFGLKKVLEGLEENTQEVQITPPKDYLETMQKLPKLLDNGRALLYLMYFYKKMGPKLKEYFLENEIQTLHDKARQIIYDPKLTLNDLLSNKWCVLLHKDFFAPNTEFVPLHTIKKSWGADFESLIMSTWTTKSLSLINGIMRLSIDHYNESEVSQFKHLSSIENFQKEFEKVLKDILG